MSTSQGGPLYVETPLLYSAALSERCGHNVYLKLEALQPSGSFKFRGISTVIQRYAQRHPGVKAHVISSSGGNAGLAAAAAARMLGLPCTVFCPTHTEAYIVDLLRADGAAVQQSGAAWDVCDRDARALADRVRQGKGDDPDEREALYVHPFEGEDLLDGHSSMIDEVYQQLRRARTSSTSAPASAADARQDPDMIVCSVGGGGLLSGILRGVERNIASQGRRRPHVVAVECFGADSFAQSYHRREHVTLDAITSAAKSLGALRVSAHALEQARRYASDAQGADNRRFSTVTFDDDVAAYSAWRFAQDTRLIVELSCSASVAPVYFADEILAPLLAKEAGAANGRPAAEKKNIVLIVCGGSKVTAEDLETWRKTLPDAASALAKSPAKIDSI